MRHFLCNELEPFAYLILALVLLMQYKLGKQYRHKVLSFFYILAAVMLYAGIEGDWMNGWSYNLLFLLNICVFSWFFHSLLRSPLKKKIVSFCLAVNIIQLLYADITHGFIDTFDGYAFGVSFITIVVYSFLYFHQLSQNTADKDIWLSFDFWLICGYELYFVSAFFIVVYYEQVAVENRGNVWAMQNIILFLCSLFTLAAFLRIHKKPKLVHD